MNKDPHSQEQQELQQHEVKEVLRFLKRYGKLIGAGILTAVVVVLVSRGIAHHKVAKLAEAETLFAQAQTAEQLEEVVERFDSTPTAPVALLNLAKVNYNRGKIEAAREQYSQFAKDYKKHELLPVAEFGLAYCAEAEGDFSGAANQLTAFLENHSGHFLESAATLALARNQKLAGKIAEARITLEDLLATQPNSIWTSTIEAELQTLD
jgi:predicted negative regulator of RcsB-dependent stress response